MRIKRLTAIILAAACLFVCSCKSGGTSEQKGPVAKGTINEGQTDFHRVEGTLHEVSVDYASPVSTFVEGGDSEYTIVVGKGSMTESTFLNRQVYAATGVALEKTEEAEAEITLDSKYIFIGCEDKLEECDKVMPSYEKLGVAGYYVTTYGKNVLINAYSQSGRQLGVLAFLRAVLGYDMFSEDCVTFERDGRYMPKMEITERPDFDYRQNPGTCTNDELYGMGYTTGGIFLNMGGAGWIHNMDSFVSAADKEEHPKWASSDATKYQACWTAHGDEEEYEALVEHIFERTKYFMKLQPTVNNMSFSQNDVTENSPAVRNCECPTCKASYDYYGNTMSGAALSLVNRVSEKVSEWLQTDEAIEIFGEGKEFNIILLIYGSSLQPPVEKTASGDYKLDENGKGIPKEESWFDEEGNRTGLGVKLGCAPGVQVMWAASTANYTHSWYEQENASFARSVEAWSGVGGEFYIWAYSNNFHSYMYPYNSFDTAYETTRYFKNLGAKYFFWQAVYENSNNTGFTKLRNYLDSKCEFDVNSDYLHYLDKFFKNYFREAEPFMRRYFDELTLHLRDIDDYVSGYIQSRKLEEEVCWSEGRINGYMSLIGKAYDAIGKYKISDPDLYAVLRKHILIEEMFPRFVLCTTYADSFSPSELKRMRETFADDFAALGNKTHREHGSISEIYESWNLG